jgi:hypothetical protein
MNSDATDGYRQNKPIPTRRDGGVGGGAPAHPRHGIDSGLRTVHGWEMSSALDIVAAMKPLSRRYLEVLDALEEYRLLRELLNKLDDATERSGGRSPKVKEPFFIVVDQPEIRTRACYIEVSWQRTDEASRAVKAAAAAYKDKFNEAALHRSDFRTLLRQQGLPYPADIDLDASHRNIYEPWWRRVFSNYQPPSQWPIKAERPESDEFTYYCLNDPDPSAVIAFWRESAGA